jgi:hypothetical protein
LRQVSAGLMLRETWDAHMVGGGEEFYPYCLRFCTTLVDVLLFAACCLLLLPITPLILEHYSNLIKPLVCTAPTFAWAALLEFFIGLVSYPFILLAFVQHPFVCVWLDLQVLVVIPWYFGLDWMGWDYPFWLGSQYVSRLACSLCMDWMGRNCRRTGGRILVLWMIARGWAEHIG